MPELIEFVHDWFAEVESTPGRLKQVAFRRGTRLRAHVRPVATEKGVAEVVDLRLADGTTALQVPVAHLAVVEERARAA